MSDLNEAGIDTVHSTVEVDRKSPVEENGFAVHQLHTNVAVQGLQRELISFMDKDIDSGVIVGQLDEALSRELRRSRRRARENRTICEIGTVAYRERSRSRASDEEVESEMLLRFAVPDPETLGEGSGLCVRPKKGNMFCGF